MNGRGVFRIKRWAACSASGPGKNYALFAVDVPGDRLESIASGVAVADPCRLIANPLSK